MKILEELHSRPEKKLLIVKVGKEKLFLKIEYVSKSNLSEEIEFNENVAKKYPERFRPLVHWEFKDDCDSKFNKPKDEEIKKFVEEGKVGKVCVYKFYTPIDYTLDKYKSTDAFVNKSPSFRYPILTKISLKHRYSLLVQILDALFCMEKESWVHGDLHAGNIGIKNVPKTYCTKLVCNKRNIPTFGKLVQIIDYGDYCAKDEPNEPVLHDIFILKYRGDKMDVLNILIDDRRCNFSSSLLENILFSETENISHLKGIDGLPITRLDFIKLYLGTMIKDCGFFNFPVEDIYYFLCNIRDTKKLLRYFFDKLSKK